MNIVLKRSYPKLDKGVRKTDSQGNPITVFVYTVTGTKAELARYAEIMSAEEHTYKDDDGSYLWFTTNPVGVKGKLCISTNGKVFADTTAIDLASALIKQYGQVGRDMARDILKQGFTAEADEPVDKDAKDANLEE